MSKLALTCGDPAGVGPESIAAWLAAQADEARAVAVIGPSHWLDGLAPAMMAAGMAFKPADQGLEVLRLIPPPGINFQSAGRAGIFRDYRLRVTAVLRDYGKTEATATKAASGRADESSRSK